MILIIQIALGVALGFLIIVFYREILSISLKTLRWLLIAIATVGLFWGGWELISLADFSTDKLSKYFTALFFVTLIIVGVYFDIKEDNGKSTKLCLYAVLVFVVLFILMHFISLEQTN